MQTLSYAEAWREKTSRKKRDLIAAALWLAGSLLVASWLFPPWTAVVDSVPTRDQGGAGFRSVFRVPEVWTDNRTFVIDWHSLLITDLGIVLFAATTVFCIRFEVH